MAHVAIWVLSISVVGQPATPISPAKPDFEKEQWCYGAARHSGCTLRLYHQHKEVWSYLRGGPHSQAKDPKHRYLSVRGISIHDKYLP